MRHTNEEIYNALTVLKELCEDHRHCEGCPLEHDDGDCAVSGINNPCAWNINSPNEWKAF